MDMFGSGAAIVTAVTIAASTKAAEDVVNILTLNP